MKDRSVLSRVRDIRNLVIERSKGGKLNWIVVLDKILCDLPEFQPPTWNDPKVSQPEQGKYVIVNYGSSCGLHKVEGHIVYPWHYVSIAPIPEPESELVKYLKSKMSLADFGEMERQQVFDLVKEFEAKKK